MATRPGILSGASIGALQRLKALTSATLAANYGPVAATQAAEDLRAAVEQRKQARRPARSSASGPRAPRSLADAPKRRSSRLDGKPATNYNENALDLADRPQGKTRSAVPPSHGETWMKGAYISAIAVSGPCLVLVWLLC